MDKILVSLAGVGSIGFLAWFFFGKKEELKEAGSQIQIEVKGGYQPSSIVLKRGKPTTLLFHRTDPSSCLEEVVLPDFKQRKFLPLNETVDITIAPSKTGEYSFSCGMNMYHGKLVVRK